jgi:hypothetical protein
MPVTPTLLRVFCVSMLTALTVEAGANAGWTSPSGTWVSSFTGKMNVPKPSKTFYNGHPLFLWPGLDPSGQATGLFQPVLTLGQGGHRDPNMPWTISNWFSRCGPHDAAKYCHDKYQNVHEGDTLSWYVRCIGKSKVFPMQFEMGWSSLTRNQSSGPFVQNVTKGARFMWATEAEPWFNTSDPANYQWLPQSPYNVWDVVVHDQNGNVLQPTWKCSDAPPSIFVNCSWSGPNDNSKGHSFQMTFPLSGPASPEGQGGDASIVPTPKMLKDGVHRHNKQASALPPPIRHSRAGKRARGSVTDP